MGEEEAGGGGGKEGRGGEGGEGEEEEGGEEEAGGGGKNWAAAGYEPTAAASTDTVKLWTIKFLTALLTQSPSLQLLLKTSPWAPFLQREGRISPLSLWVKATEG
ncbi:hypothetical protein QUB63_06385 [Microcoleus sp. ARI1-B5]|uniref:hypothetical protein n=1 Tax=unclassified Microcoleus TaxID=2642155 RepID=UPI002FCF7325